MVFEFVDYLKYCIKLTKGEFFEKNNNIVVIVRHIAWIECSVSVGMLLGYCRDKRVVYHILTGWWVTSRISSNFDNFIDDWG
jgi:hypothetical protein